MIASRRPSKIWIPTVAPKPASTRAEVPMVSAALPLVPLKTVAATCPRTATHSRIRTERSIDGPIAAMG
jgi:hypothetical protein